LHCRGSIVHSCFGKAARLDKDSLSKSLWQYQKRILLPIFSHIALEVIMSRTCLGSILAVLLITVACGTSSNETQYSSSAGFRDAGVEASPSSPSDAAKDIQTEDVEQEASPVFDSGFTGDGSINKDVACAVETIQAEEIPVDLFIMADSSTSMSGSGWSSLVGGLNAFFTDPVSKGISIALSFFPYDGKCQSADKSCSGDNYFKPQVQWGVLPGHASVLADALAKKSPDGCTPTQDALNGVLRGAFDRQKALQGHTIAAVIVSDGDPCCNMCPIESDSGLGQIAYQYANPAAGEPSIKTFAIYAASEATDSMTAIAINGGTKKAYNATGGTASFIAALDDIRTSLLACEYKMPVPEAGVVNPEVIEVEFTSGTGSKETIPRVKSPQTCGSDPGWRYDDDSAPTRIILCPASCDDVQDDAEGRIDVLVGCTTSQR